MRQFCTNHRRALFTLSLACALFAICMTMTACNVPVWLSDAESLVPILLSSITSVLSFIAAMTGNPALSAALALITPIINDVGNELEDLQSLISQYKTNPGDSLIQEIEQVAGLIQANLGKLVGDLGLPAPITAKIQSWASLVLSQLQAWLAILPQIKAAVLAQNAHTLAKPAADTLMSAAQIKAALNEIWTTPTGDPTTDAALKTVVPIV